jgi:hypothetical protein
LDLWILSILLEALDGQHATLSNAFLLFLVIAVITDLLVEDAGFVLIELFRLFVICRLDAIKHLTGRHIILSLFLSGISLVFILRFLFNDVLLLDLLVLGAEVVGQLVLPNIF